MLEAQQFPRFSIGESLLAHCLDFVEEAGMMPAVEAAGFQYKNGAAFVRGEQYGEFDFGDKFTPGRDSTYQVQRATFDKVLADEAAKQGVEIRYEVRVGAVTAGARAARARHRSRRARIRRRGALHPRCERLRPHAAEAARPGDALEFPGAQRGVHACRRSRSGRRLRPQQDPGRRPSAAARRVVLADSRFRTGAARSAALRSREFFATQPSDPAARLRKLVSEEPFLARVLANAEWDTPVRELSGYAANVRIHARAGLRVARQCRGVSRSGVLLRRHDRDALGEHGGALLDRQLRGEQVDWQSEFEAPLRKGVDTFRAYVRAWYDGRFQDIMFAKTQPPEIRRMICSILAGYAWDENESVRRRAGAAPGHGREAVRRMSRIDDTFSSRVRAAASAARSPCARRRTASTSSFIAARAVTRRRRSRGRSMTAGRHSRVLQFDVADRAACAASARRGHRDARRVLRRGLQCRACIPMRPFRR